MMCRYCTHYGWLLLLQLLSLLPHQSTACGGFFCQLAQPVIQSGEAIVFGVKGNQVTMHVQIQYQGPAEGFSWVLPVPFEPNVTVGSDRLFTALFQATLPDFQLDIQQVTTETCSEEAYSINGNGTCPPISMNFGFGSNNTGVAADGGSSALVLQQGSVGPFDFAIIEAADNDPTSVFRWLEENGYDQPDESAALLNYYALNDHKFVALRLQKEAETGEIQPLILKYEMPATDEPERSPIACVPIQLTRIAATENMPIQVYILGSVRASPLNFIEMELDDTQVPWLRCGSNNDQCFYANYIQRFNQAAEELSNHSFVTEYAGPANIVQGLISISVTYDEIASVATEQEFFDRYFFSLPTNMPLVSTILEEHTSLFNLFNNPKNETWVFNATLLAQELQEKVLRPALDDQAFVDSFSYLTRLFARLSPPAMTKDPFFAFKEELPNVDRVHRATALPICTFDVPTALEITVEQSGSTVTIPASFDPCLGRWLQATDVVIGDGIAVSPARQLASWGFTGDDGVVVIRSGNGTFDMMAVEAAIAFGDSLVMSQEIPEYTITINGDSNTTANTLSPDDISRPPSTTEPPVIAGGPIDNIFDSSSNRTRAPTPSPVDGSTTDSTATNSTPAPGQSPLDANGTMAPSVAPTSVVSSAPHLVTESHRSLGVASFLSLIVLTVQVL